MKKNIILILLLLSLTFTVTAQVDFIWGKQFGTVKDEKTRNLVIDLSNNVYVVGKTKGVIGNEKFGKNDGFIVKIDSEANTVWSRQIGTTENDELSHVAVDESGNIYAVGFIGLRKQTKNQDILVVKLSGEGDIIWQKEYGTNAMDAGTNIIVDELGNIFICGFTRGVLGNASQGQEDCFILHLDNMGKQLNVVQFGTPGIDRCDGITMGKNNEVYVCGYTSGKMASEKSGELDLFWGRFSKKLQQQTMKQFGTNKNDYVTEIKTDSKNNVYLGGGTEGSTVSQQKGNSDAFLQKWNEKGEVEWTKQFGTNNWDGTHSIAVVEGKGIIVSGCYDYPLCKSFVKMYDELGTQIWDRNMIGQGLGGGSCGKDICVNPQGTIYHAGYTGAALFSDLKGEHDLFVVKLKAQLK